MQHLVTLTTHTTVRDAETGVSRVLKHHQQIAVRSKEQAARIAEAIDDCRVFNKVDTGIRFQTDRGSIIMSSGDIADLMDELTAPHAIAAE